MTGHRRPVPAGAATPEIVIPRSKRPARWCRSAHPSDRRPSVAPWTMSSRTRNATG